MLNIFLYDLLTVIKKSQLCSFVNDNTISAVSKSFVELLIIWLLIQVSFRQWFCKNRIKNSQTNSLNIYRYIIKQLKPNKWNCLVSQLTAKLNEHISMIIYLVHIKALMQLNAINCLPRYKFIKNVGHHKQFHLCKFPLLFPCLAFLFMQILL